MPTGRSTRTSRRSRTLYDEGGAFRVSIEKASGVPSFENVPDAYKGRMMKSIKRILKRRHQQVVVKELKKGDNEETYSPEYAAQKNRTNVNVRSIKGLISGKKRYTANGPVDFIRSGQLYNSLVTDVKIKGSKVISKIVVGKDGRRDSNIGNRRLVEVLDREKNLKQHATDAVRRNRDTLIVGTIKKAINAASRG